MADMNAYIDAAKKGAARLKGRDVSQIPAVGGDTEAEAKERYDTLRKGLREAYGAWIGPTVIAAAGGDWADAEYLMDRYDPAEIADAFEYKLLKKVPAYLKTIHTRVKGQENYLITKRW